MRTPSIDLLNIAGCDIRAVRLLVEDAHLRPECGLPGLGALFRLVPHALRHDADSRRRRHHDHLVRRQGKGQGRGE